jgi:hypothetical protein
VPEFRTAMDKQTHLYLVPRNAMARISTNKNVKLRMGYSYQSVLVNSTSYEYRETGAELIKMEQDSIKTLDKYGKVTIILEESQ